MRLSSFLRTCERRAEGGVGMANALQGEPQRDGDQRQTTIESDGRHVGGWR